MTIRTFKVEDLEELEPLATNRHVAEKRWANVNHVIYKIDDKLWRVEQYEPASELQEDIGPWGYGNEPDEVEAVEVEEIRRLVLDYVPAPFLGKKADV